MKRFLRGSLVVAALFALAGGAASPVAHARGRHVPAFRSRPAAKQLPDGFVLPSADVDLKVSSLVAADVDADGDLDIVASSRVGESVGILVWLNDGAGRLTRRSPSPSNSLGGGPASPSVEQHQAAAAVPIPPDSPAIATACERSWLALFVRSCERPRAPDAASAILATLRSRAPPSLS